MVVVQRFEDLSLWKEARDLANTLFACYTVGAFSKDFELRNQVSRSAGSIMDNIAEGFERGGNKEFIQFLLIAKGSAGEVRSQLYRAFDRKHLDEMKFSTLKLKVEYLSRGLASLIKYLKSSEKKGFRYH